MSDLPNFTNSPSLTMRHPAGRPRTFLADFLRAAARFFLLAKVLERGGAAKKIDKVCLTPANPVISEPHGPQRLDSARALVRRQA